MIVISEADLRKIIGEEVRSALRRQPSVKTAPDQADGLLTKRQVADRLKCSTSTVDNYVRDGLLTKVPLGIRSVRFRADEVDKLTVRD